MTKLENEGKDVTELIPTPEKPTGDVNTFDNSHQHGVPLAEHVEDHSLNDDLPSPPHPSWNDTYSNTDTYEDKINSTPFGRLVDRAPDFISNAPNMSNHQNVIGDPNSGAHPTQAVDFFGDVSSYFSTIPSEIPGFINVGDDISILKSTVLGFGFDDGISNSNLGNIFDIRNFSCFYKNILFTFF